MEGLYTCCENDSSTSMYNLTGFKGADFKVRRFMAVTSLASLPTETILLKIMKDDRVLRQVADFEQTLEDKITYIETLPIYCFERLRRIAGDLDNDYSVADLKHDTLEAAHISVAYVFVKLLYFVHRLPFKLTQGDIGRNLEELFATAEDQISDHLSLRIFHLHELGVSFQYLVRCLQLLRDTACTTNMVEQCHGSGACLMRDHQTYEERTLRARSMVHQARSLFTDSAHDKLLMTLQRKLDVLEAHKPHVSGFRAFVALFLILKSRNSCEAFRVVFQKIANSAWLTDGWFSTAFQ